MKRRETDEGILKIDKRKRGGGERDRKGNRNEGEKPWSEVTFFY